MHYVFLIKQNTIPMYLCRDIRKKRTDQVNKGNNNITEQSTKGKVKDLPTLQF